MVPLGVLDAIVPGVVVGPGVEVSSYLACRWRSEDTWGIKFFAMNEKWWEWSVRRSRRVSSLSFLRGGTEEVSARIQEKLLKWKKNV